MQKISAVIVAVIMSLTSARYCWLTYSGEIKPVLATWILFEAGVVMSILMYFSSGRKDLWSNIANTVDVIMVTTILFVLCIMWQNIRLGFNQFEVGCLIASGMVLIIWFITNQHEISHGLVQVIMTIAYFPTIKQLWEAKENTEPFSVWTLVFICCCLSTYASLGGKKKDWLAFIYSTRAVVMVGLILVLMFRISIV